MTITIHPLPAPGDNNMFLKLMYREIPNVQPLSLADIFKEARRNPTQRRVIHLHWEAVLYGSRFAVKSVWMMLTRFPMLWVLKHFYGVKMCWTVHNFKSHDYPHPFLDRIGRKIIFTLADGIIIQQKSVADQWRARYPKKKIVYIPLGNYIGAYGPLRAQEPHDDIRILSFGAVKPYKNIECIVQAFQCAKPEQRIRLMIVGIATPAYAAAIERCIAGDAQIVFQNRRVPDSEMANLLEMAEYSIFWYDDSVLTSGGLGLSLSYGLPAIIRNIPAADRIRSGENGFLFDDSAQLAEILKKLPPPPSRQQVVATIADDSWAKIANQYEVFYGSLFPHA